jgi:dTDP-4-dehydrorhamnose 3,5-epimerase
MKLIPTDIPEVLLIEPEVHRDERGFLLETWHAARYAEAGVSAEFVQDNHSRSRGGILRGLHLQRQHLQGKLVRALRGEIYDVSVDVRRGSPSFGRFVAARLSEDNFRQLWIPPGFAHGFAVLSDEADVAYKCTDFYHPGDELAVAWNDPEIGIPWPLRDPLLSERDRRAPRLAEVLDLLPRYGGAGR